MNDKKNIEDNVSNKREICLKELLKASKHTKIYKDERGKHNYTEISEEIFDLLEELDRTVPGTKVSLKMEVLDKTGVNLGTLRVKRKKGKKKTKEDKIQICSLATKDRIIEEIYDTEERIAKFLVYYKEIREIEETEETRHFTPKIDDGLRQGNIILPEGIEDYGSSEELKNEIKNFIHTYVDVSERFEEISAWYVLLTWVYDKLNTIPYLRVIGDSGTGKSRYLEVVGGLCYHAISGSGAVTPAPIYRIIKQWKPTLKLDEFDVEFSNEKNEIIKILNCGFEKNKPVMRCKTDDPDTIEFHNTFCPKLIATRYRFRDLALESRCITEEMKITVRKDIPIILPKKFYEKQKELQKKLLKFRLDYYHLIKDDISEEIQKELEEDTDRRVLQATSSFLYLTEIPELKEVLRSFIKEYNTTLIKERQDSKTGIVVNALFDLLKIKLEELGIKLLWEEDRDNEQERLEFYDEDSIKNIMKKIENIEITPGDVASYIEDKLKIDMTPQKVGRELKAVGIEKIVKKVKEGSKWKNKRVLVLDYNLLNNLELRYILPEQRLSNICPVWHVCLNGSTGSFDFFKKRDYDKAMKKCRRTSDPNGTTETNRTKIERSQREKIQELRNIIWDLDKGDGAEIESIIEEAKKKGISKEFIELGIRDLMEKEEIYLGYKGYFCRNGNVMKSSWKNHKEALKY